MYISCMLLGSTLLYVIVRVSLYSWSSLWSSTSIHHGLFSCLCCMPQLHHWHVQKLFYFLNKNEVNCSGSNLIRSKSTALQRFSAIRCLRCVVAVNSAALLSFCSTFSLLSDCRYQRCLNQCDSPAGHCCLSVLLLTFSLHQCLHNSYSPPLFLTCPLLITSFFDSFFPPPPNTSLSLSLPDFVFIFLLFPPIFPSVSPLLPLSVSLSIRQTALSWWAPYLESLSAVSGLSSSKLLCEAH